MNWKQDDDCHFANHDGRSALVVRAKRRWLWRVFRADGTCLWHAHSRTLDEAKDDAGIMLQRAPA